MDICKITLIAVILSFLISTITDLILFRKLFKTKGIVLENNREIYDHDRTIADLQEEVDAIKNG